MTRADAGAGLLRSARAMTELRDLQPAIISKSKTRAGLAPGLGWRVHHDLPVQRDGTTRHLTAAQGNVGYPDLTLAHPIGAVIVAELKTQDGQLDPEQVRWGETFAANPGILYVVWRPLQLLTGEIAGLLGNPRRVLTLAREQAATPASARLVR